MNNGVEDERNTWLFDSGATSHMCCIKEMFDEFKPYHSSITVADGNKIKVKGIENVDCKIKVNDEIVNLTIYDVFYVPNMKQNLISIGRLASKGLDVTFKDEMCLIKRKQSSNSSRIKKIK